MGLFGRIGKYGKFYKRRVEAGVYNHPVLGEIMIARNPRARRISISVRPASRRGAATGIHSQNGGGQKAGGAVRLTLPPSTPVSEGLRFLDSRVAWVAAARERIGSKTSSTSILPPYSTRKHTLALRAAATDRTRVRIADGVITVTYPATLAPDSEPVQNAIKKGVEEAWRIEARELLPRRVAQLAREHGFRHGTVTVRNTVSKWGSCSAHNDLSLSLHLMRLPDHLIDYILLHELCHTVHHNHGADFHKLLGSHTGGHHLALRKELRNYNTRW